MSVTDIETEIRIALEDEAARYPFPEDLAHRTWQAVQETGPDAGRPRWRRRWVYAVAAAAAIPVLFLVGVIATHLTGATPSASPVQGRGTAGVPGLFARSSGTTPASAAGGIDTGLLPAAIPSPASGGAPIVAAPTSPAAPSPGTFTQSVVSTASLDVRIPKGQFSSAWSQAMTVAAHYGGLVSTSNAQTVNGRLALGTLTLQVPASNLDAALGALEALGKMTGLTTSSQDVSGQVASNTAQLTGLQAEESQYLQLLPQAKSTADILAIETPLNSVEQQIETLQASQSYLQSQVAMASIQATLSEPGSQPAATKPEGRFAKAWHQATAGLGAVAAGVLVGAGYLAIPALLALGLWMGIAAVRRRVV